MTADVDPQRAVAGKLLSAVRADLLLLARVRLKNNQFGVNTLFVSLVDSKQHLPNPSLVSIYQG